MERTKMIEELIQKSKELRVKIVQTAGYADRAHVTPAFSAADLVAGLYFHALSYDPKNPDWDDRDRFILSAGHKCLVAYCALNMLGVISDELLTTFDSYNSPLGGHTCAYAPGVEVSTGSLGHGLSIGVGMAIRAKNDKKPSRVFVLVGDGECHEGSIWEAAAAASKYKLDNLVCIMDYNNSAVAHPLSSSMPMEPYADKWRSFGWEVIEIDGHNMEEIVDAYDKVPAVTGKPTIIMAHTIKGKGVKAIEYNPMWHCAYWNKEQIEAAVEEIMA